MPDTISLEKALRFHKVEELIIDQILHVKYKVAEDPAQDNANYFAKAIPLSESLLPFDLLAGVMFDRACCKSGYRLANAKQLDKEHGDLPLPDKLALLGQLRYMGKPFLNADGDIETVAVGTYGNDLVQCPCWRLKGRTPQEGKIPLAYCLCCAGHFQFHYEKALNLKLKVKQVVSTIVTSDGKSPVSLFIASWNDYFPLSINFR